MVIVLIDKLTKEDIVKAREEHKDFIKITIDINQKIIAIGGEFHADAEKILLEKYGSLQKDIWGGGYDIKKGIFETLAIINIRHNPENLMMEIIDPEIKQNFIEIAKAKLLGIESLI